MHHSGLTDEELLAELPPSLAELSQIMPLQAVLMLVESYGGIRLKVPYKAAENSVLASALGSEPCKALVSVYGGDVLDVPRADRLMKRIRDKQIFNARSTGESVSKIARRFKLTRRAVHQIINRLEEKS